MISLEKHKEWIHVRCRYVRFNGIRFGTARTTISIHECHGDKLINELPVFPLEFHADLDLEEKLADRGSRMLDFQGISYRNNKGYGKAAKDEEEEEYDKDEELKSYRVSDLPFLVASS